jgi:hypothetical protein
MSAAPLTPLLSALDPATAPLDGKTARDRLAFVAQFARLVQFYTIHNRVEGTWQPFMLKDAAILLAAIAATDYHSLNTQFQALTQARQLPAPARLARLPALLRLIRHMVSTLAHWLTWLDWQPEDFPLRRFLAREVSRNLAPGLAHAHTLQQALALRHWAPAPDTAWYKSLGPAWQVAGQMDPQAHLPADKDEQAQTQAQTELRQIAQAMLNVVIQTVDAAAQHYDAVAAQPTPHPDTALLRVFVDLMRHQQQVLNGIGRRHLDFYYQNILQIERRSAQPDHVVVMLSPQPGQAIVSLPAGTRFAAGKDAAGAPVFFANAETAVINAARIAGAFSLKSDPGTRPFLPGIHPAVLNDLENLCHDAAGHPVDQRVFGTPCPTPQGLGFALSSPMLLLEAGSRSICLTLDLAAGAPDLPADWAVGWGSWMTTTKGWLDAGTYALPPHFIQAADGKPDQLLLEWMLPPDAPALQAATKPQDGRTCLWPQVKVMLPPAASAHPWPRVTAVTLEVKVRAITNLSLWSTQAPLTPAVPYPLGPVPQTGSRFLLGSGEIFAKPITRLTLTLDWGNPPPGLANWYQSYNAWQAAQRPDLPAMTDDGPGGSWQWLEPEGWKPATVTAPAGISPQALFQGKARSIFTLSLPGQRPFPWLAQAAPLANPSQAKAGYIAFTLENPPQAFGHQIYPQVLMWASQQQALALIQKAQTPSTVGAGGQAAAPPNLPNPAFTPALKSATADYAASYRWVPGADAGATDLPCPLEWHHYGPWHNWLTWQSGGPLPRHAPLAPGLTEAGLTLVPRVAAEGCLLLAVRGLPAPGTLRLHAAVTADGDAAGFTAWRYDLSGWKKLEIWQDDTAGLSAAGILEISIPEVPTDLGLSPTLTDCAWLALTPKDRWRPLSLALLASQAVQLVRQDLPADAASVPPIAPGTISKAPLPALAGVRQPLGSTGGRGAERGDGFTGSDSYYRRVAHHLSHKGRAMTARDLVLLAHDVMPELFHAEVMPVTGGEPGEIRLGVVPRKNSATVTGAFHPRVSPGARTALATRLQECSPDAATLSVHNMTACTLTLSAGLILSETAQAAWPSLRQGWNQALRLYLSPWIDSDLPRYDLRLGLVRADLLRRIAAFPGVYAIDDLRITITSPDGSSTECRDERLVAPPGHIWVSAALHQLSVVGA